MPAPKPTPFALLVETYLKRIAHAAKAPGASPELSLRPALAELLDQTVQLQKKHKHFHLSHEAISESEDAAGKKIGRPDFILFSNHPVTAPVGYCEAESIDADLRKLTGHALHQNTRYKENLDNFLLTNHLSFELYVGGQRVEHASLPDPRDLLKPDSAELNQLERLLERFFSSDHTATLPALKDPRDLAEALARRTRQLHSAVEVSLPVSKYLQSLKTTFEKVLLPQLTDAEFADLYAQTVAYGLFAARCAVQTKADQHVPFDRQHAVEYIPKSNPFLRELFDHVSSHKIEESLKWITDDIARLLDAAPYVSIRPKSRTLTKTEDPVIHFYETFLKAYNPAMREMRGVYYTPEPVVTYIVRSVDELLKTRLNRPQGLADPCVKILDPATGTGTFLAQTILHIHEQFGKANNAGAFDAHYIEKNLVPRLFGFELLVAPYTVAHLKLNLLLRDLVPDYDPNRRLEVYLTNSLEPPKSHPELPLSEFISDENNHAAQIKANENILVVIGNPPYSGHSANNGKEIKALLHGVDPLDPPKGKKPTPQPDYFKCDGKPLGERNPKWLNDDYVKFIRFAQWRIDRTGEGVLGFITNHGYLDNPTFRGMRQALMQSFSEIHVLDLHGNDRKKEIDPATGLKDENVFDIQQGVAILLAVKRKGHSGPCRVFHADLFGKRAVRDSNKRNAPIVDGKYAWLWEHSVANTNWEESDPSNSFDGAYRFVPPTSSVIDEYGTWPSSVDVMPQNLLGFQTHRDGVAVAMTEGELHNQLRSHSKAEADSIIGSGNVQRCAYRPFDRRFVCLDERVCDRARWDVTRHMLHSNLAVNLTRQTRVDEWANALVSDAPTPAIYVEIKDGSNAFPLYLYPTEGEKDFDANPITGRRPNYSDAFLSDLARALDLKRVQKPERAAALSKDGFVQYSGLPEGIAPEDIFHYAYAVLHSPTYRSRYAEFLKMDFPRLPLPGSLKLFRALATHGGKLVALHLLDTTKARELLEMRHGFPVSGSNVVEPKFPKWVPFPEHATAGVPLGRVFINGTQYFDHVHETLWTHKIGGYQVPEKWLKDRRERKLTSDEISHYQRTLIALEETQKEMDAIDETIDEHGGWPGAFESSPHAPREAS